jgi:hypothetical protein
MTNGRAYAVIAKHTFVAYRKYEGDRQIIVFATNIDEAEYIAKRCLIQALYLLSE